MSMKMREETRKVKDKSTQRNIHKDVYKIRVAKFSGRK